jgi:hypothetical protein
MIFIKNILNKINNQTYLKNLIMTIIKISRELFC